MSNNLPRLSIGKIAERTGLSVPTIRFYEEQGLVKPIRTASGQRRYRAADIRRLSFVMIAQQLGFTLKEIESRLAALPEGRTPSKRDWSRISREFHVVLQERIDMMTKLQELLDGCIGCGCLSLAKCKLYNPEDRASVLGSGPRYLLGDTPSQLDQNG